MKDTIKALTEGMQRLCAVANRIVQGPVNRIEVDLLLEDLRHLYDVALRLNGDQLPESIPSPVEEHEGELQEDEKMMAMVSTMAAMTQEPEAPETPKAPEVLEVPETPEVPEVQEVPEVPVMPEIEDNALLFDEVIVEPETVETPEMPKAQEVPETPKVSEAPVKPAQPATGQASLLDYLNQPAARTLGETLGGVESGERSVENVLEKKVDDLRTVININDKFSFMSELFKGNMKAYNDFVMHLNALTTRDEAMAHVREIAEQYKWNEESMAVKTFYKIFDKKF